MLKWGAVLRWILKDGVCDADCIYLAQDGDQWWAVTNTETCEYIKGGELLDQLRHY
jgi:hypothetical protein